MLLKFYMWKPFCFAIRFIMPNLVNIWSFIGIRCKIQKSMGPLISMPIFTKKRQGATIAPWHTSLGSHVFMSMKLILITLRRFTQFGMINWTMEVGFCWFQKYENLLILRDIVKRSITNSGMWNRGWHSKAQFCLLQFWRKVSLRDAYTFNDFPFIPRWPFYVKIVFPAGVLKLP